VGEKKKKRLAHETLEITRKKNGAGRIIEGKRTGSPPSGSTFHKITSAKENILKIILA